MDARAILAWAMPEDKGPNSLDAHVRKLMDDLDLLGYHTYNSQRSRKGYPDWTIVGSRIIFRELKAEGGKPSPDQKIWLAKLDAAGADVAIWRPSDLLSGRIAKELRAISHLAGAA
jgi:hypothetical protein